MAKPGPSDEKYAEEGNVANPPVNSVGENKGKNNNPSDAKINNSEIESGDTPGPHQGIRASDRESKGRESQQLNEPTSNQKESHWWGEPLAVATVLLAVATFGLDVSSAFQLIQMRNDSADAGSRFNTQMMEAHAEATAAAERFKTQISRADAQVIAQLSTLKKSIDAANAEVVETHNLAIAAATEAAQSAVTANASRRNAEATATQAALSRQLVDETSANSALDERPWIWTRPREDRYDPATGLLKVYVDVVNSGKTPALHTAIQLDGWAMPPTLIVNTIDDTFTKLMSVPSDLFGPVPPSSGAALFNKGYGFKAAPPGLDRYLAVDRDIAIAGRIRYQDSGGRNYHTDFCYYRLATGAYRPCEKHNDMR